MVVVFRSSKWQKERKKASKCTSQPSSSRQAQNPNQTRQPDKNPKTEEGKIKKHHATAKPRQRALAIATKTLQRRLRIPASLPAWRISVATEDELRARANRRPRSFVREPRQRAAAEGGRAGGGSHRPTVGNDRPDAGSNHVPVTDTYLPMVPVIWTYTKDFSWKQRAQICKISKKIKNEKEKSKLPHFYDKF